MSELYGMHVQFTAQPGQADALTEILLEAARGMEKVEECLLYVVSRSGDEADVIVVTEAWVSESAHAASLEGPGVRALIGRAMPLMAGPPRASTLRPAGGKGL